MIVLNNGIYNEGEHSITWKFENVLPGQSGFVEFNAVIGDTGTISNQADIQLEGISSVKTNIVETTVCKLPRLGWIPFSKEAKEEKPIANMKDETTMGLTVNFAIPGMMARELRIDDVTFHRFSIPGYDTLIDVGKPELPIVGQILEIPQDVDLGVEIIRRKP